MLTKLFVEWFMMFMFNAIQHEWFVAATAIKSWAFFLSYGWASY